MAAENFVVRNGLIVANSTTTHVVANSTTITANSFTGNGSPLTTLNASELSTGTVASARLSGTYDITANNSTYLNGQLSSYYLSASNLNTGTLPSARLSGSYTILASNATLATKANGTALTFTGSAQSGTPTYVWGGDSAMSSFSYSPANFSVNYATSAGSAGSATSAASATLATKASTLSQGGGNGTAMTFNWVGQAGQPTYLWGSNDGVNHYVWTPSNFSVNYATSAGNADTVDGYHGTQFVRSVSVVNPNSPSSGYQTLGSISASIASGTLTITLNWVGIASPPPPPPSP